MWSISVHVRIATHTFLWDIWVAGTFSVWFSHWTWARHVRLRVGACTSRADCGYCFVHSLVLVLGAAASLCLLGTATLGGTYMGTMGRCIDQCCARAEEFKYQAHCRIFFGASFSYRAAGNQEGAVGASLCVAICAMAARYFLPLFWVSGRQHCAHDVVTGSRQLARWRVFYMRLRCLLSGTASFFIRGGVALHCIA